VNDVNDLNDSRTLTDPGVNPVRHVDDGTARRRYRLDASTRTVGDGTTLLGGSPLRLFRLTDAGRRVFDDIAAGTPVTSSTLSEQLIEAGAIHPIADLISEQSADQHAAHSFRPGDVTVIVPTHDTEPARLYDILRHCLDVAGVVFVDDGSHTPLSGMRGATLVRLRQNSGPAAARNAGYRAAETPLVAFVDTDVDLHPGWLEGLLGHFDDDRVGVVAPRVASGAAVAGGDSRVARYEERHSPLDLGAEPARIAPGTRVSYVPGAALIIRKEALDEIDGFDATLRCGEDVDAVWRLAAAGWRGRYEPSVVVEHHPRRSWRALSQQRAGYGESAAALAATHGSAVAPVRISPWSLGVWGLAGAGRLFSAAVVAGGTAMALIPKLRGVPATESLRLAGTGHFAAGRALADAVRRTWFPVVALGAIASRRARRVGVAAVVPALLDGGPARLFDDVSYGVGVWRGVLAKRRLAPLLPAITAWPEKSAKLARDGTRRTRTKPWRYGWSKATRRRRGCGAASGPGAT
jgi:mycofactocin system glycosyltransferase